MSSRNSPEMIFDLMGFGRDPARLRSGSPGRGPRAGRLAGSLATVADALSPSARRRRGDRRGGDCLPARGDRGRTGRGGHRRGSTPQGVGLLRRSPAPDVPGQLVRDRDVDPAWDLRDTGWHVLVEGDTPLDVDIHFPVPDEEWAATSPSLTAHRPVNAVPYVCNAAPGIRTTDELPQIIPNLG